MVLKMNGFYSKHIYKTLRSPGEKIKNAIFITKWFICNLKTNLATFKPQDWFLIIIYNYTVID
ncbi:hypothetical protein CFOLD11_11800 [Clostridium folliculivorans]|uniref:Uncharacterized protein n=1 Tax=Clostridium folliculivorans TaxID=2886038 RepID=A0A9W5Y0A2_9CLOT|nr:hypothetical protein CFOLD11_11800 [Clostridium folliculivorans]